MVGIPVVATLASSCEAGQDRSRMTTQQTWRHATERQPAAYARRDRDR
jgi:hypothetical protein